MFDNIGGKIKTIAKIGCWVGIIASAILGILLMMEEGFFAGIIVMVALGLASWISSLTLYGFGDLIENTAITAEMMVKADFERNNNR